MTDEAKNPNIIVADDDPEMLLTVSTMVSASTYRPVSAQNFEAFRRAFTGSEFAVMLDLVMPGKDSEKIMELLSSKHYQGPIIFITGAFPEDIAIRQTQAHNLNLHVIDVLIKPFWIDDVARSLNSINS